MADHREDRLTRPSDFDANAAALAGSRRAGSLSAAFLGHAASWYLRENDQRREAVP